ncbi:MAG: beta-galactosidase [Anaerolineales bacterium]|nr:beta-galactosidase [Anaerolineales bacterium]
MSMRFGVCYYPEHWPAERWAIDARLMSDAGISIVRIGEFAWAQMEPAENQFDWDWLDKAIDTLAAENLEIVLGTPTAAPPAWLCKAYPAILPVDSQGHTRRFGSRGHRCVNSTIYRCHTARIVKALAERYWEHPAVTGWQIDNEFGCHDTARCYCQYCTFYFRRWLQARYKTIDALNKAWGTAFWSQIYSDWEEIDPPILTVTEPNPSHLLDYYRFSSDSYVAYQQLQIDILKSQISNKKSSSPENQIPFITTNLMGNFTDLDYHALARPLDFICWDSYPTGYADVVAPAFYTPGETRPSLAHDVGDPDLTGFCHDLVRGMKQAPFWIMEQQCGNINWSNYNTGVNKGAVRLWAWHALVSGAEAVVYFRWRACLYSREQLHSGLLRHDGSHGVGYTDLMDMLEEYDLMRRVAVHPLKAQIALLMDYRDLWAIQLQPHHLDFSYLRHLFVFYRALKRLGLETDIVSPTADLSRYKIIIAPTLFLGDDQLCAKLTDYTMKGGTLLIGIRSGIKTTSNRVTDQPLPGVFYDLAGTTVTEWQSLPPGVSLKLESEIPILGGAAGTWVEVLDGTAKPLARYASGPLASRTALTENKVGDGRALYMGWYPGIEQASAILNYLTTQENIDRLVDDLPAGIVLARRGPYTILLNFTNTPAAIRIKDQLVTIEPRDLTVILSRDR